jgi:hypothetical protein
MGEGGHPAVKNPLTYPGRASYLPPYAARKGENSPIHPSDAIGRDLPGRVPPSFPTVSGLRGR